MQRFCQSCCVAVLSLLGGSGCFSSFQKAKFNGGLGVEEELLLAVPFSHRKESRWYGESEDGGTVIQAFKVWARKEASPNFAEGEDADAILRQVRDWPQKEIRAKEWQKLTAGTTIKYVLYGEIESDSFTKKNRVGLIEPSITASYRLIDVQSGKKVFEEEKFELDYSKGRETDFLTLDFDSNLAAARTRLLTALGEQVGKDLYGYYKKW